MLTTTLAEYAVWAEAVVREAASQALTRWCNHLDQEANARTKPDSTPVTVADTLVERYLRDAIRERFPSHSILGEELGADQNHNDPSIWVIDPIDGTKNYLRGFHEFATQLALVHEGKPVLGVSSAPALQQTVVAFKGGGSWSNGEALRVSRHRKVLEAMLAHGGIVHFDARGSLAGLLELCAGSWGWAGTRDFLSYHHLAAGRLDAVVEARTRIWDIAALSVVVSEAGGRFTDLSGRAVGLETDSAVATNGFLHDEVLRHFASP
jgi:histidinol-phosphatase